MLIAFGLMGAILIGWQWVGREAGLVPADAPAQTASQKADAQTTSQKTATPLPNSASGSLPGSSSENAPSAPATAPVQAATNKQTWYVDTDVYHVVFSNEGGVAISWTLKKYKDAGGHPLQVVNLPGAMKAGSPVSTATAPKPMTNTRMKK